MRSCSALKTKAWSIDGVSAADLGMTGVINDAIFDLLARELMTHPGCREYKEETALLQSQWIDEMPFRIEKISYAELSPESWGRPTGRASPRSAKTCS
jgi:hypothetical protein